MHTKTHLTVRLTGCAVVEQKQRYSCIRVPCKKFSFGPSVVLCVLCGCVAQLSSWIHPPHLIGGLNCFAVLYHSRQRYVEQASVPRIQVKLSVLVASTARSQRKANPAFCTATIRRALRLKRIRRSPNRWKHAALCHRALSSKINFCQAPFSSGVNT